MERKTPVWTRAMRQRAAEHGRMGSREAKQVAGLASWLGKTPEQQAEAIARLQASRQTNDSPEAKAAQARRAEALGKARTVMSARQAAFLADRGMLRREEVPAAPAAVCMQPAPVADPAAAQAAWLAAKPERRDYADQATWIVAMKAWAAARP